MLSPPSTAEANEGFEKIRLIVPAGEHRKRIDVYLSRQIENATRSKVQTAIESGMVLVNGKPVKSSYKLNPNDVIDITFQRPPRMEAKPEDIPLNIIFEDDSLLVINKPAGMVMHPAYGNYKGTLVNALLHHCNQLSKINTELRPGIIHRLDKDTTGLVVVAKNDFVHAFIAKQFSQRTIERDYWAIVWGHLKSRKGVIEANLGRSKRDRKKVAVVDRGKHAVTEFEVLREFDFLSLICLHLKTGRTHQIRVHLSHIGHPVFGDPTYNGRDCNWGGLKGKKAQQADNLLGLISRQALHAKTLGFVHPVSKEFIRFDSQLPEDMQTVLKKVG